jgi:hypothetical protein
MPPTENHAGKVISPRRLCWPNSYRLPPVAGALPLAWPPHPTQISTYAGPWPPLTIPLSPVTFFFGAGDPHKPTLTLCLFLTRVHPAVAGPASCSMSPLPQTALSALSLVWWLATRSQSTGKMLSGGIPPKSHLYFILV